MEYIINNWQWFIGFIISIIALIIAFFQLKKQKAKKDIQIINSNNSPISTDRSNQNITYNQTIQQVQKDHETDRLLELKRTFYFEIKSLTKPIKIQIEEFQKYYQSFKNTKLEERRFNIIMNLITVNETTSRLSTVDLNRVFPNSAKEIYNIKGDVGLIVKLIETAKNEIEISDEKRAEYRKIIFDSMTTFDEIISIYNATICSSEYSDNNDLYLNTFFLICKNHLKKRTHDIYFGKENLIMPLYNLTQNYPDDERNIELNKPIRDCIYAYDKIENNIRMITNRLIEINEQLQNISDSINMQIEHFA
jgi:hypothetical protein